MDLGFMYKYTLEIHLKNICNNSEYTNLYATWELNKKTYASVLNTVSVNYPHYSLHDKSHSESIITNIEMLLGEDRIKRLSPTETWMILQCAYLHDFGMAILYEKIESEFETENFKTYINNKGNISDNDLVEAINYINNLKDNLQDSEFESCWPLKVRKYITHIIADYFRAKHSNLTKEYLTNLSSKWNIDISHNGLIHERLINLIGDISFLHTQNFKEIMELSYKSNGYKSDYIHPRFIAEMLRVGDLLDLDNGRFGNYNEKINGKLPLTSQNHKEKHKATRHVLITPEAVEVVADCSDEFVYRETRNWFLWLEEEISNLNMNWTEIIPNDLTGYAPKLTKKIILLRGKQDLNNIIDLRFNISQEKAFDIIEGSNIYNSNYVFLREFIQNSLDASKIQLWRDLKSGIYDSWLKIDNKNINELNPFDIDSKIYKNYKIDVKIQQTNDKNVEIIIKDRGTGISLENLKAMSYVGNSYDKREELKKEIRDMPNWLRPTGGFGIGIQSAFLITESFEAYSQSDDRKTMKIVFESRKSDGYIQVTDSDKEITRGTEIHFVIDKKSSFSFSSSGYVSEYLNNGYDPMINDDLIIYNVIDNLYDTCKKNIFPVEIHANRHTGRIEMLSIINLNGIAFEEEGQYSYKIDDDLHKITMWIKKTGIYLEIVLGEITKFGNSTKIAFKGINLDNERFNFDGFYLFVDIHGMDTKKTLKLNRNELTNEGHNEINTIIKEAIVFYITKLKEKIDMLEKSKIKEKNFNRFSFFIMAKQKLKDFDNIKYKYLIDDLSVKIKTLKKVEDNFEIYDIEFRDIAESFPNFSYVNIENFREFQNFSEEYNYNYLKEKINENKSIVGNNIIVIDEKFIPILSYYLVSEMKYIDVDKEIFIYSIHEINKDNYCLKVDKDTEEFLIKLINYEYNQNTKMLRAIVKSQRRCIPAIEKYSDLVVESIPFGIEILYYNLPNIISPITKTDCADVKNYSKEIFLKNIIEREDYKNLVKFVYKNHISCKLKDEKAVSEIYEKLIGEYYDIVNR